MSASRTPDAFSIEGKFHALVVPVLGEGSATEITKACWALGSMGDVRQLTALCRG